MLDKSHKAKFHFCGGRKDRSAIEIDMLYAVAMLTVALIVPDLGTSTCLIRI